MPHRLARFTSLTVVCAALLAAPVAALASGTNVMFPPATPLGLLPNDAAAGAIVGDVDGDGTPDAATAVADTAGGGRSMTVWVTFAPGATQTPTPAGGDGWHGFRVVGAPSVYDLAGLPDVNGDGRGEVAIDFGTSVVVVYGQPDGTTVDLGALGTQGFTITGADVAGHGSRGAGPNGALMAGHGIAAVGDQNGDGRADLLVATTDGAAVVATPSTPGVTLDASGGAGVVFTLQTHGGMGETFVGDLGDLDGDGRDDPLVVWQDSGQTVHVAGAAGTAAGATVDLRSADAGGHGFVLDGPGDGASLEDATAIGDQNGDGRRDTMLAMQMAMGEGGHRAIVRALTPALGTHTTFTPGSFAVRYAEPFGDELRAIGDVDGDGIEDLADETGLELTTEVAGHPDRPPYPMQVYVFGSIPDRSGDGRPEPIALQASPTGSGNQYRYTMLTEYGLPDLLPYVGNPMPIANGLPPASPNPVATPIGGAKPAPKLPAVVAHGVKKTGTKKADHLTGTPYADVLKGLAGNDVIRGLAGNDTVDGGPGRDRIDAGAGNDIIYARDGQVDTIDCGPGHDRVIADRGDKVKRCESVSRPKPRKKHAKSHR